MRKHASSCQQQITGPGEKDSSSRTSGSNLVAVARVEVGAKLVAAAAAAVAVSAEVDVQEVEVADDMLIRKGARSKHRKVQT